MPAPATGRPAAAHTMSGWQSMPAAAALDNAGFAGSDLLAERIATMLTRRGHHRAGEPLDQAVAELAADLPELFGRQADEADHDAYGELAMSPDDVRRFWPQWRAMTRAGFAGNHAAMRRAIELLATFGPTDGGLLDLTVQDLRAAAPELFADIEVDEDDDDEADELDYDALYAGHLAAVGDTYEGPMREGPPELVGYHGATARMNAALAAQAGIRPPEPHRRDRPQPRDATERMTDRMLRSAGL